MIRGLLGRKIGMTQAFDKEGNVIPITALEVGPCYILELKESPVKVKVGFEEAKESRLRKPELGYFKKVGVRNLRVIQEFASTDNKDYTVGQELKADIFRPGDYVNVTGTSIGKGFQGGMKRWHWVGGPKTHGSMHHRRIGSNGSSSYPSRVFKGHHMPGHQGAKTVTVENLRVIDVDVEKNLILLGGAVPGHKRCYLTINRSFKKAWRSLDDKKAATAAVKRNPMKQSKAKTKGKA